MSGTLLTYLIVDHHDRHHDSLRCDAVLQQLQVHQAVLLDRQVCDLKASVLQVSAAVQHTLVVCL